MDQISHTHIDNKHAWTEGVNKTKKKLTNHWMRNENGGSLAAARSVNERWAWWASKKNRNTPSVWHRQYQNMKCVKTIESKMVSFMHRAFLSAACYQPTYNILFSYGEHNRKEEDTKICDRNRVCDAFQPVVWGALVRPGIQFTHSLISSEMQSEIECRCRQHTPCGWPLPSGLSCHH